MPETLRLRVRTAARAPHFDGEDDAYGAALWGLLEPHLERGVPRATGVVRRSDSVLLMDLAPLVADPRLAHRRVAGLASLPDAESLAVVGGLFRRRRGGPVQRYAVVFVEWPDGRWWLRQRRLDDGGDEEVQRAVDGLPRPGGLGGWFGRARFERLHVDLSAPGEVVN